MSLDNPSPGIGSVVEFSVSPWPWVTSSNAAPATGSPVRVDFPRVTKTIVITNTSGTSTDSLSFGFSRAGVVTTNNKFVVKAGQTVTIDVKTNVLFLQSESGTPAYSIFAGLTSIFANQMPLLTSSLWSGI
jgi:hypothetical protein